MKGPHARYLTTGRTNYAPTSRKAALLGLTDEGLCAPIDPEIIAAVENQIECFLPTLCYRTLTQWGLYEPIRLRKDWTMRCYDSLSSRSIGGSLRNSTLSLDEDHHMRDGVAAGMALRLAHHYGFDSLDELDGTTFVFNEYSSFNHHLLIGGRTGLTWIEHLKLLVAHEASHAVQFNGDRDILEAAAKAWQADGHYVRASRKYGGVSPLKGHEQAWQCVYADLRQYFELNAGEPICLKPVIPKKCKHCGAEFPAKNNKAAYCSSRCKVAAHRALNLPTGFTRFPDAHVRTRKV